LTINFIQWQAGQPLNKMKAAQVLYRSLLREACKFPDHQLKQYIKRRTIQDFHAFRSLQGEAQTKQLAFGEEQLALIKRQSTIRSLYLAPKSVVELRSKGEAV
jgi:hypothetical protein